MPFRSGSYHIGADSITGFRLERRRRDVVDARRVIELPVANVRVTSCRPSTLVASSTSASGPARVNVDTENQVRQSATGSSSGREVRVTIVARSWNGMVRRALRGVGDMWMWVTIYLSAS